MASFDIIEYMSGLTSFVLDEAVLKRIALDRGVMGVSFYEQLSQKQKDLLLADILYTLYVSASNIPSFQRQHGQFSTSTGSQTIDKNSIYNQMLALYKRYHDPKLCLLQESSIHWVNED